MLNASRKGKRRERDVVRRFRELGCDANRDAARLESDGRETGVDVRASVGDLRLAIQVRARARVSAFVALDEARAGAELHEIPVACVRRTRGLEKADDLVVLSEDHFFALIERLTVEAP